MKKAISLILILLMCLSLCACAGAAAPAEKQGSNSPEKKAEHFPAELPKNIPMYLPGTTVKTDTAEITIIDAAFCGKAQIIDALPRPTYNSAKEGRIVFAMRTLITNTGNKELVLMDDLKVSIQYGKEESFGCSKGGNYKSSDPLYKTLPAGESGEYIICGRVPVELVQANAQFSVSFNKESLGFDQEQIQVYNSMGYQQEDNVPDSLDNLIASAGTAPAQTQPPVEEKPKTPAKVAFAMEEARCEKKNGKFVVEVKFRNNSDMNLPGIVFNGSVLDTNGDVLENCFVSYWNGLEAGQAGWESLSISEPATLEAMDSIKFTVVWYKEDPQAPSHNIRFDLPEPFVIDFQELEMRK